MANHLDSEPSPYLQQHKDNPVDWFPWSKDTLAEAKLLDKPLLVSIGYSACHWCHVMAHESFENEEIAAYMNQHFINIKIDREERPDIDNIYMTAVQAMTGQGGWPLNMFATPDGIPFFGGTYWPPADRRGMPGFPRVLEAISTAWANDREQLLANADSVQQHIQSATTTAAVPASLRPALTDQAFDRLYTSFDATYGGFGTAPKFPQAPTLDALSRHYRRTQDASSREMLTTTLDYMAAGGIHDHLEGGFARYAVDQSWTVPHFEKMLYDNTQLMCLYLDAWSATSTSRYADVAISIGTWLLREMLLPDGGFASALDADSEGVEGKFSTWRNDEIDAVLPERLASVVKQRYGISPAGNFEGSNILTISISVDDVARQASLSVEETINALSAATTILRDHRRQRIRPGQDSKVVTAWNGLAITAFARVGATLSLPDFVGVAQNTARFLMARVKHADGTLWRTWNDGQLRGQGVLEDYVFLAEGLIALHQADGNPEWLRDALGLIDTVLTRFIRENGSDFYDTASENSDLPIRSYSTQDNATPAGNSVAADVLLTMGQLTDRDDFTDRAFQIIGSMEETATTYPTGFGRYLAVRERLLQARYSLVIGGDPTSAEHAQIKRRALRHPQPAMTVVHADTTADPELIAMFPILANRQSDDGTCRAWLCREGTCMLPATSIDELNDRLSQMDQELSNAAD